MTKKFNWIALLNIICTVLLLAVLVLQFIPYFVTGEKALSIQEYLWFSTHHNDVSRFLGKFTDSRFAVNDIALTAVLSLVMGVVAPILCIKNHKKVGFSVLFLVVGLVCGLGYLTASVFHVNALWIVLAVANLLAAALSIPAMVILVKRIIVWFTVKN